MATDTDPSPGPSGCLDNQGLAGCPTTEEVDIRLAIRDIPELRDLAAGLDDDVAAALKLTPQEVAYVRHSLDKNLTLASNTTTPMICLGDQCPRSATCPLLMLGKHPLSQPCPIETALMAAWTDQYLNSSLDVDREDKLGWSAILQLVEVDILQSRANAVLAKAPTLTQENQTGVDMAGNPTIQTVLHVGMEAKDMLWKRQERLLKSLVATLEMKKKLGEQGKDRTSREADIMARVKEAKLRDAEVIKKETTNP